MRALTFIDQEIFAAGALSETPARKTEVA
jgi:hypothetical protein